jgi:hypothetical protein
MSLELPLLVSIPAKTGQQLRQRLLRGYNAVNGTIVITPSNFIAITLLLQKLCQPEIYNGK